MGEWGLIRVISRKVGVKMKGKKTKTPRPGYKKQKLSSSAPLPKKVTHYAMVFMNKYCS